MITRFYDSAETPRRPRLQPAEAAHLTVAVEFAAERGEMVGNGTRYKVQAGQVLNSLCPGEIEQNVLFSYD